MSALPTVPPQLNEAITNLVTAVDEGLGDDFSQPARLLMFEPDTDGLTFGIKELPAGQHPLEELMGFVALDEWAALGAVCHGWASRDGASRPSKAADRFRVRAIHVVTRDGFEVGGFRVAGGQLELQETSVGMVPDALRRCLGLATPAAQVPAAELSAADWLDAIADGHAVPSQPPIPYKNWEDVRWEVITRRRAVEGLTPTLATWMDAGMFARWMTGTYPRTSDQLAAVRRILDGGAYEMVLATLVAWGVTEGGGGGGGGEDGADPG